MICPCCKQATTQAIKMVDLVRSLKVGTVTSNCLVAMARNEGRVMSYQDLASYAYEGHINGGGINPTSSLRANLWRRPVQALLTAHNIELFSVRGRSVGGVGLRYKGSSSSSLFPYSVQDINQLTRTHGREQ